MFIRPTLDPVSETAGARHRVRDPHTMAFLADDGEEKPDSEYWHRRLLDGGVELAPLMQGEPLKLTDEERARLPALGPAQGEPVQGVSDPATYIGFRPDDAHPGEQIAPHPDCVQIVTGPVPAEEAAQ